MTKRLCKMSRKQIAEQLGDIHRVVAEPKFMCHSCARVSADKQRLCKPVALPSFASSARKNQTKPANTMTTHSERPSLALPAAEVDLNAQEKRTTSSEKAKLTKKSKLVENVKSAETNKLIEKKADSTWHPAKQQHGQVNTIEKKEAKIKDIVQRVKARQQAATQSASAPSVLSHASVPTLPALLSSEQMDKKALKQAKKALKKQRKEQKKWLKVIKKKKKLLKRQRKIAARHNKVVMKLSATQGTMNDAALRQQDGAPLALH